jgi:hypothetical protein
MQGPRNGDSPLQPVQETEHLIREETKFMVDVFAEGTKAYWKHWAPQVEPIGSTVDEWAKTQRAYLQWLEQVMDFRP